LSISSLKNKITAALATRDYDEVARLAVSDRRALTKLVALAYVDKDDVMCWRAIEAMGAAAAAIAKKDTQRLRNLVQRILWSAREESGGMGWSAPELLAEIASASPRQFADIPPIIVSLHVEDEEKVFLKGVLWAIARMAEAGITEVPGAEEVVLRALEDSDPQVRGLAARAAVLAEIGAAASKLKDLAGDESRFVIYRDGGMEEESLAKVARSVR
jgi:hypothetical protein